MANFFTLYFRGLVFTVLAVFLIATIYGLVSLAIHDPAIVVPVMVVIILPLVFGAMTEGL